MVLPFVDMSRFSCQTSTKDRTTKYLFDCSKNIEFSAEGLKLKLYGEEHFHLRVNQRVFVFRLGGPSFPFDDFLDLLISG